MCFEMSAFYSAHSFFFLLEILTTAHCAYFFWPYLKSAYDLGQYAAGNCNKFTGTGVFSFVKFERKEESPNSSVALKQSVGDTVIPSSTKAGSTTVADASSSQSTVKENN